MSITGIFEWTDEYSVGIDEIDEQHKVLFELINRLFHAAVNRDGREAHAEILDTLIDYTRTHFQLEENLMAAACYADLDAHREEHARFVAKMEAVAQKFLVEEKNVTFELINFLKHWLREHILETDKQYAAVLASNGFVTDAWSREAHAVATRKKDAHAQKPWWKFWNSPAA